MKKELFFVYLIVSVLGCHIEQPGVSETSLIDTLKVEFRSHDFLVDYKIDSTKFLILKTGEEIIPTISKVLMSEDMVYILSKPNNTIYALDLGGNLVFTIDHQGNGPQEYNSVDDFGINIGKKILEIIDLRGQRILRYSALSGKYLEEIDYVFYTYTFAPLEGGGRVFHNSVMPNGKYFNNSSLNAGVFFSDSSNKIVETYLDYDSTGITKSRLVTTQNIFRTFDQDYLYAPLYSNKIFKINSVNETFQPRYLIDLGRHSMPTSFLKDYKGNPMEFDLYLNKSEYAHYITDFYENRSHISYWFLIANRPYKVIHDKKMKRTFAYERILKTGFDFNLEPIGVWKNQFITSVNYETLKSFITIYESRFSKEQLNQNYYYQQLLSLKQKSSSENPILMFNSLVRVDHTEVE